MVWLCASLTGLSATPTPASQPWEKTVTTLPRGDFPNARPLAATYKFGWNGIVAAVGEVTFDHRDDYLQVVANGQTVGLVRLLWKFDVYHSALSNAATLRPIGLHQVETTRRKTVTTDLSFHPERVERIRRDTKSSTPPTPRTFSFPGGVFDLLSAGLYIRSQPLRNGDVYRLVVYPASSAYLATITVSDHSSIRIAAGSYPAIKLDLQLNKIGRQGELEPHKKFRHGTIWVSDDSDRMLLRIEASIFVGTVFAELQSLRFPNDRS